MDAARTSTKPEFFPATGSSSIGRFSRASFTPVGSDKIYAWGARGQTHDFAVLDWKTRHWDVCETVSSNWPAPGARHAHTATEYTFEGRTYIVVYGGYDDDNHAQPSTHIYDVGARSWVEGERTSVSDDHTPSARSFHTATYVCVDNEPYLFVVGGLHLRPNTRHTLDRNWAPPELCVLNLRTKKWYPSLNVLSRYGHAAVLLPGPADAPRIFIIGGRDARGKSTSLHFIIDVQAVLSLITPPKGGSNPPNDDFALSDPTSSSSNAVTPWKSLGPFSDSIGPFHGTSHLWAARSGNVIYVLGQPTGDTRFPPELFPDATAAVQSPPYCMWALTFDTGWSKFENISSITLPSPSSDTRVEEIGERWMWCGILDSGLRVAHDDSVDDVDWSRVPSEKVLFALNASRESNVPPPPPPTSANDKSRTRSVMRCLCVPLASLPSGTSDSDAGLGGMNDYPYSSRPHSFERYLPPLWDPSNPQTTRSISLHTASIFQPDISISTSTPSARTIPAHTLVLGSRSSYFHMLLTSGFGDSVSISKTEFAESESESRTGTTPTTTLKLKLDEPYIIAYSLIYFLYTDAIPPFLSRPQSRSESSHYHVPSSSSPDSYWASTSQPYPPAQIVSDLLVAADKYLFPASFSATLRRAAMQHHIRPENAVYIWRAAYLTRRSGGHAGRLIIGGASPSSDNDDAAVLSTGDEENWVARRIRDAYEARDRHRQSCTPAYAFYAEVSRWCARRLDEIRVHYPYPEHVTPGGAEDREGEGEGDEDDEDEDLDLDSGPYAVEEDIREAFWEEMRRLTGSGTGTGVSTLADPSSTATGVENA